MKLLKTLSSFEIILVSLRPSRSFSDEGTFSVGAGGKLLKQLIDVHENAGLIGRKKILRGRVLVITAVR